MLVCVTGGRDHPFRDLLISVSVATFSPPVDHKIPRVPDLPECLVPSSSDNLQWLKKTVSELYHLSNKSDPQLILHPLRLRLSSTRQSAPLSSLNP